jgi:hypothetical protein
VFYVFLIVLYIFLCYMCIPIREEGGNKDPAFVAVLLHQFANLCIGVIIVHRC